MRRMTVKESKPGMVLARPITDQQGRVIVNAGTKLNPLYISRLEKWGITEVIIVDEAEPPAPAAPAASAPASSAASPASPARAAAPAAAPAAPAPAAEAGAGRPPLPPGVYRGADLVQRHERIFAAVAADPLMAALARVIRRRLLAGR